MTKAVKSRIATLAILAVIAASPSAAVAEGWRGPCSRVEQVVRDAARTLRGTWARQVTRSFNCAVEGRTVMTLDATFAGGVTGRRSTTLTRTSNEQCAGDLNAVVRIRPIVTRGDQCEVDLEYASVYDGTDRLISGYVDVVNRDTIVLRPNSALGSTDGISAVYTRVR